MFFPTLKAYDYRKQLFKDCIAGLTVGALCVPQSMSYAGLAGLPVENGLYSDLQIAYQAVGTSRHLVVGPVAVMSLLTYECLVKTDLHPLTREWIVACSLLSLCVGLCQFVLSAMRMGDTIANALSENTIKAFTSAASVTIASTQLPAFLGCRSVAHCMHVWQSADEDDGASASRLINTWMVSLCSVFILEAFRFVPHPIIQKLGALVVLFTGIALIALFQVNVDIVGHIPAGLPSQLSPLFTFDGQALQSIVTSAAVVSRIAMFVLPMSLIGFAESFAIAKTGRSSDLPLHANRELFALGLANIWTSALGGYPVTGSFSRSAVNLEAGASSCVSALVAFALVMLVLGVFTSWLALLPKACVSCIVLTAILRLVDFAYIKTHLLAEKRWADILKYLAVFTLGVFAGIEFGLLAGFAFDFAQRFWLPSKPERIGKQSDNDDDEGISLTSQ